MREDLKSNFPESNAWRPGNIILRCGRNHTDLADPIRFNDDTHGDGTTSELEKYFVQVEKNVRLPEKYFSQVEKNVRLPEKYFSQVEKNVRLLSKYSCLPAS